MTRVLVVDDEKNVITTLKIGLKRKNFEVFEAPSGPEAIKLLEEQAIDVMVSDIRMAPMDGYSLARNVRMRFPEMGIILMSAYSIDDNQFSTLENLSCTRLIKPFSIDTLLEAIDREVNKGRQGNLLLLGDERSRKTMRERAESIGYRTGALEPGIDLKPLLNKKEWRGVLVDGDSLDESFLPILNLLDRLAPELPVVLLARNSTDSKKEQSVLVLDKQRFLEEADWAERTLSDLFT